MVYSPILPKPKFVTCHQKTPTRSFTMLTGSGIECCLVKICKNPYEIPHEDALTRVEDGVTIVETTVTIEGSYLYWAVSILHSIQSDHFILIGFFSYSTNYTGENLKTQTHNLCGVLSDGEVAVESRIRLNPRFGCRSQTWIANSVRRKIRGRCIGHNIPCRGLEVCFAVQKSHVYHRRYQSQRYSLTSSLLCFVTLNNPEKHQQNGHYLP
jgi:hypothetical protein